jgi:hypothetical protein
MKCKGDWGVVSLKATRTQSTNRRARFAVDSVIFLSTRVGSVNGRHAELRVIERSAPRSRAKSMVDNVRCFDGHVTAYNYSGDTGGVQLSVHTGDGYFLGRGPILRSILFTDDFPSPLECRSGGGFHLLASASRSLDCNWCICRRFHHMARCALR